MYQIKSRTRFLYNAPAETNAAHPQTPTLRPQPKRILGIMPNYRAVSAGVIPPPPTPKEAFKIATKTVSIIPLSYS